jgi:phage tail-like protein
MPNPNQKIDNRTYAAAHFALELNGIEKIGVFRSVEGGGIKADVMTYQNGGIYDRWRQLGKPKFEDVKLQVGMSMTKSFYEWVDDFFAGQPSRKDGTIIAADFFFEERARRHFSNAMIKEMTFPKLDANDKNSAYMGVTIAVEDMAFVAPQKGNKLKQTLGSQVQKSWKACNFRFLLDKFDCCKRVTKVESFTVKQNILEYHAGGMRSPTLTPSAIDFPQLSFTLPEADADPLIEHFAKRGVKGEVPGRFGGHLETYDNEGTTKFTLSFNDGDILNIQPDKSDATTEEIKMVKVDFYIESMKFKYEADSDT